LLVLKVNLIFPGPKPANPPWPLEPPPPKNEENPSIPPNPKLANGSKNIRDVFHNYYLHHQRMF
jgi:hypothetical protein